jgi:hypothetical protein
MDLTLNFLTKKKCYLWLARIYVKIGQVEKCLENLWQAVSESLDSGETLVA